MITGQPVPQPAVSYAYKYLKFHSQYQTDKQINWWAAKGWELVGTPQVDRKGCLNPFGSTTYKVTMRRPR